MNHMDKHVIYWLWSINLCSVLCSYVDYTIVFISLYAFLNIFKSILNMHWIKFHPVTWIIFIKVYFWIPGIPVISMLEIHHSNSYIAHFLRRFSGIILEILKTKYTNLSYIAVNKQNPGAHDFMWYV